MAAPQVLLGQPTNHKTFYINKKLKLNLSSGWYCFRSVQIFRVKLEFESLIFSVRQINVEWWFRGDVRRLYYRRDKTERESVRFWEGGGGLVLRPTAETATRRACVCDVLRAAPQCRSRIDSGMPRVWCQWWWPWTDTRVSAAACHEHCECTPYKLKQATPHAIQQTLTITYHLTLHSMIWILVYLIAKFFNILSYCITIV